MTKLLNKQVNYPQFIVVLIFLYIGVVYFSIALANIFLGLAMSVFVLALFLKRVKLNFKAANVYKYFFVIVPFMLTILSLIYSNNNVVGLKFIWLRIPILVVPFLLIFTELKTNVLITGLKVFVLLTVIASLFTIYNAIRFINEDVLFSPEFTFFITIIQHPYLGVFVLITILSIIEFQIIQNRALKIGVFAILILTLSLTTSRMVYLMFLILSGVYLFKCISKRKAFGLISIFTLTVISIVVVNHSLLKKFESSFEYQNSPRLKLWSNAYKAITFSDNPILGIGIGDYYENKQDVFFFKESKEGLFGYNPHSQLVEFYVTNGLLGLGIVFISIICAFKNLKNHIEYSTLIFSGVLLFSLTETIFTRQYGVQLYSVFIPFILRDNFKR